MKLLGRPFLALLAVVQLVGWLGYGRSAAVEALLVIVVPSSLLIGSALFWAFYWNRRWLFCMPAALILVHIEVVRSGRTTPGSALLCHAMNRILGKNVDGWEAFLADSLLLAGMLLLATAAAFGTAEIYRLCTGRGERGGIAFFRDLLRDFTFWEKAALEDSNK